MKRCLILALCACMALGLMGCAAENWEYVPSGGGLAVENPDDGSAVAPTQPAAPQELTLTYYAERSTNPFTCTDYTNRTLFSLVYQGLFSVNRHYEAVPILCSRYQVSKDMKTYTFYLDENATFSDGSQVTVQDVLASYNAARESSYYSGRFTHIADIRIDGSAIVFQLSTAMEDLLILLDIPVVKASQVADDIPLGSGPYTLNAAITSGYLDRVANWWCEGKADLVVTAQSIPLLPAESPAQIRDEFQFYDLDLVCANPCSDLYADYRCDFELWDCENGEFIFLACNAAHRDLFRSTTLRSVLTYAIDRDAIVGKYYQGFARSVTLPASTYFPYYSEALAAKYEYAPEKFTQVLENISRPTRNLVLLVNSDDSLRLQVARDVARMLTELGLPTVTEELDSENYMAHILAGNYDMYLGCTRLSANMDLSAFFKPYGGMSYNGVASGDLYQLCLDALENHGNYYNLYQEVAEDGRIVPLIFCSYAVYATRGLLSGLEPARDNIFFYTTGQTLEDILVAYDFSSPNP